MKNQKFEDMDKVEALLLLGGMRYKRIAPSVILVLPTTDNDEFSETDIQWIKETLKTAKRDQKLRKYDSKQAIVIFEEIEES